MRHIITYRTATLQDLFDECRLSREAQAVLPKEANAYELVGDPTKTGGADSQETCLVQGYRIEVDHTQRLVRQDALANDYDRMMQLLKAA